MKKYNIVKLKQILIYMFLYLTKLCANIKKKLLSLPVVKSSAITIFTEVVRVRNNLQETDLYRSKDVFSSETENVNYVSHKRTLITRIIQVSTTLLHGSVGEYHLRPTYKKILAQE